MIKTSVSVICIVLLATIYHSQAVDNAQEAAQFVDRLLKSAGKEKDLDSASLTDVEEDFTRQYYAIAIRGHVVLSDGTVSGLSKMIRVGNPKFSKEGNVSTIVASIRFPSLRVRFNQVDTQTIPKRFVFTHFFTGTIKDTRAQVTIEYDEDVGGISVDDFQVVTSGKGTAFRFVGGQSPVRPGKQLLQGKDVEKAVIEAVEEVLEDNTRDLLESIVLE